MGDPYLKAIIESVESGGDPVWISVALRSGAVVTGFVRSSDSFATITKNEVRRTHDQASFAGGRVTREQKDAMWVQAERIDSIYASRIDDDDADGITLSSVTMLWSSGEGLSLKTIRLDLDAIAAWWVANGNTIKAPKDSNAFWAVGIGF